MEYKDFYKLAKYASENWKGKFTEEEIACYAYDYLCEFERSKKLRKATPIIQTLINNLEFDVINNEDADAEYWLMQIREVVKA